MPRTAITIVRAGAERVDDLEPLRGLAAISRVYLGRVSSR